MYAHRVSLQPAKRAPLRVAVKLCGWSPIVNARPRFDVTRFRGLERQAACGIMFHTARRVPGPGFCRVEEMSQIIADEPQSVDSQSVSFDPAEEFAYRPVSPLAPISLFLGVCAISGFAGIPCLAVGVVGFFVGALALILIRRAGGELGGRGVAWAGMLLSATMIVAGSGYHAYAYVTELPEGYERVSFQELSNHLLKFPEGKVEVAPEVAALDGKPIFIKGYMYPTGRQTGISEFVLVKDTGQCCFGGQPKFTDMIIVKMDDGMTVNHREQVLVGVAGTFRAVSPGQSGVLTAIYQLEARHF